MSVLLLVRHGQASFGAADYDKLSELGVRQSRVLGRALAERGVEPALLVTGGMRRHRETVEHAKAAAGWDVPVTVDAGWDEFDHEHVIEVHKPFYRSSMLMKADLARALQPRQAFQQLFVEATTRWANGEHDEEYTETFGAFGERVTEALRRTSADLASRQVAVVFTSGGPIARVSASLLLPSSPCEAQLWGALNITTVNTAVTKVVTGSRGSTLVSTNDHSHLEAAGSELVTYR